MDKAPDRTTVEAAATSAGVQRVGVVGLGVMGGAMARNLLRAGYEVTVFNRTRTKAAPLAKEGARVVDRPAEVARRSEAVITNVTDTADVEHVVFGPGGIAEGAAPGSVVIDMSTISPDGTRRIARRLQSKSVDMLDAPVTGGDVGAREGTLSIMVGGPRHAFQRCLSLFHTLGARVVHVGPAGTGQTVKLVNQVIVALHLLAMAEGLAFAAKGGVDVEKALHVVRAGAAGSWALDHLAPRVLQGDYAPGFAVDLQQKDLRLALHAAAEARLPLPGTALVQQLLRSVQAYEGGGDGTQALVKALERLGNFSLTVPSGPPPTREKM